MPRESKPFNSQPFDLQALADAQALVGRYMQPTPQYCWPLLCEALGTETWVKHENHTPTGAFKVRGGITYIARLLERKNPPKYLITATRGNHGQSIPYAATRHGIAVKVFVPEGNSQEKNDAMRAWGAQLEVTGKDFDLARHAAEQAAAEGRGELVPSFHDDLILGVATYGLELMTAQPDLDTIYAPIGMGSGICALIRVRDLLGLKTEIVGVVSSHADAMARSLEAGRIIHTETALTFADGVATRMPNPQAFEEISRGAARVVRVSDDEVAEAIHLLYRTTHNVAEGAGAVACAAACQERLVGKKIGVVLSGRNIDAQVFMQVLSRRTPG